MKKSSDKDDNYNLISVYGALFFGVPSQGMDTEALAAMVGDKPQRYDLSLLNQEVGHRLRSRQHEDFCRALDFEDSKIIQFFETRKTSTVVEVGRILVSSVIDN
jgi:predicted MarR family transcription regulator